MFDSTNSSGSDNQYVRKGISSVADKSIYNNNTMIPITKELFWEVFYRS